MTMANTNNMEVLFQNLSEEDIASISGGQSVFSYGNASASFTNNVGGIALTSVKTTAVDQGTHTGTSDSSSLSVAYNDTNETPRVGGPGNQVNVDQLTNNLLGV